MPGISLHVVDVTQGRPCTGMAARLEALGPERTRRLVAEGRLGATGVLHHGSAVAPGEYEASLDAGAWYAARGENLSDPPFLGTLVFRFAVADPEAHYHLPFKISPWGMSVWRGA